ncbi:Protein DENND6B [Pseudolycoriella hygida]|uniref:Protein DENND6B n=1 Tax=Pseudolycoriella hygida TaxID=35572 RepID=A0A9Q0NGS6_9DIPT|nr:Protein DENND6B [Pseudolycoriella hygida]
MATKQAPIDKNEHSTPPSPMNDQNILHTEKWQRFSDWLHCICVVNFDLELGQALEAIYPPHIQLGEQEKSNICYLAFPDSNSGCMGDTQFHVRLRVAPATENTLLKAQHIRFNSQCIPVQRADSGHYWGFVYFRQIKDNRLPRGYFQKSIVLLTRLPFVNLFYEICSLIAPQYFDDGELVLESACDNICHWPALEAGESLSLHLLGTVFQTVIPKINSKSNGNAQSNNESSGTQLLDNQLPPQVLSSVHEIDLFRSLFSVLTHIHLLWELVLVGEPIVVMASSPTDCSLMVQSLLSLIAPIAYAAESRPYFTIHDSEFKEFTQQNQGPPPVILGVTNPFFAKTLSHWPHTIRLIDGGTQNNLSIGQNLRKVKSSSRLMELSPGVYTQYKPFLQKDKSVIKKVMLGVKMSRPSAVQSCLLRRHMLELTQSFMIPLERYMASLMPLQKDISPFKAAPTPHPFKQDDFLATLEQSGPQLTSTLKGDWEGLYKRFFRSPNFKGWYENRYMELTQTLQTLQLQALSEVNLIKWTEGKHEVEIVDMILKLEQKLKICNENFDQLNATTSSSHPNNTKEQLQRILTDLKCLLPDDLKTILSNT